MRRRASLAFAIVGDSVVDFTAWQALGHDAHSFLATPADVFLAPGSDFHLRPGAPAVDAGSATGAPTADLDGAPRPVGAGVDVGAYELQLPDCAGWSEKRAGRFRFEDEGGALRKARLRDRASKAAGLMSFSLRGEAGALALPAPAGLVTTVVLGPAAGACAALAWNGPETPRPRCREKSDTITCR